MGHYSYSKVSCHHDCAYKYKLTYIDKLEPLPDLRPNNPLYIGTAGHEGIEKRSIEEAIASYKSNYSELTEDHEMEIYKLTKMVEKANSQIPEGEYEYKITWPDGFTGFIDELHLNEDGTYTLYDFKFAQNANNYKNSAQLHMYKYFYEKVTGNTVRDMYYAVVPKVPETLNESMTREKLTELIDKTYESKDVQFVRVDYNPQMVNFFFARKAMMDKSDKLGIYEKRFSPTCRWCPYKKYCESNGQDTSELVVKEPEKKIEETDLWSE